MRRLFVFALVFLGISCGKESDNKDINIVNNQRDEGLTVELETIDKQDFQKEIISNGIIEAAKKTEMRFTTNNIIERIFVKNGQTVKKGDVLAVLNNNISLNELNKAKIAFEKSKLLLREEMINYEIENNNIDTDSDVIQTLKIKSGYSENRNLLEKNQLLYDQTFIRAPYDGVVGNIKIRVGNFITSSDVFCTIVDNRTLEATFYVLESEFQYVRKNQEVKFTTYDKGDKYYRGKITEINPLISEDGLIQLKATVFEPDRSLIDGMHVKIFIVDKIRDVLVVPKKALVLRSNREVVFTVHDGKSKWNYVEILAENSTSYAIKGELKVGDKIIVSGNINLSHDTEITPTSHGIKNKMKD